MKNLYSLLFVALLMMSCKGPQYHYKQGNKFAALNLSKRAVTEYKLALDKKPDKVKYVAAMHTEGRKLLEELYTVYRLEESDSAAVYSYEEAAKWTGYLGAYIDVSEYQRMYGSLHSKQLERYLKYAFGRAQALVRDREFLRAKLRADEVLRLDANYPGARELLEFTEVEPVYTKALAAMERREYRPAYNEIQPILERYPNQEELRALSNRAVELGKHRIGIVDVEQTNGHMTAFASALRTNVIRNLQGKNDPFIELLDRANFDLMQEEQNAIIEGKTDAQALMTELLVAHTYLRVQIQSVDEYNGPRNSTQRKGWEKIEIKSKDSEGKTITKIEYRKVNYTEVEQEHRVSYSCSVELVDRATSKILLSEAFSFQDRDQMHYVDFAGRGPLYPGEWRYQNKAHPSDRRGNEGQRRTLDGLRKASRSIKAIGTMRENAHKQLSKDAADAVYKYILSYEVQ